jgi:ferredoxin-type protein NapG
MSESGITRRSLVGGAVGALSLLAVGGAATAFAGEEEVLRPPGGQDYTRFIGNCIRCDRCRSICPLDAISVANNDGLINARTPKMSFRKGYCNFCGGELLCVKCCPTEALTYFDFNTDWIGPAVIIPEECIAFQKAGGCRICVDACPYLAITLNEKQQPIVDLTKCNGCGYCEYICPSHKFRSYSGSAKRGINVEHSDEKRPS